ncbi:hypothetical protein M408DRAFT_322996 [Serendipita vermifera MAFF 305830]|uniref:VWFA domain-containing protein n=1 Tax=Serendipita vermifera MAFF 305830 TaxID=933852 RepID=A0A0C2W7R7_SERVB|nr:hypothetical protein M408DRAFT_322996 [Serendipita vermifera MAFF 305830]
MPLESCMLVIDNSEHMRNGDYPPNRFDAQTDAITVVFSHKVDSNPENTAGVMTMAGKSPEVLVTPTQDVGKILSALHSTKDKISGSVDVVTAIQVAQLALKHRQNKNLRQRIIAFVGSPLSDALDEKTLVKVGKKLKKNNVALDVVCYGEWEGNEARLKALVDAVQNSDNRCVGVVRRGDWLLFGALRMSVEEEQARQRTADTAASTSAAGASTVPNTEDVSTPRAAPKVINESDDMEEDDPLLAQAIAMSTEGATTSAAAKSGEDADMEGDDEDGDEDEEDDEDGEDEDDEDGEDDDEVSEEEAIAQAIALSMQAPPEDQADGGAAGKSSKAKK